MGGSLGKGYIRVQSGTEARKWKLPCRLSFFMVEPCKLIDRTTLLASLRLTI